MLRCAAMCCVLQATTIHVSNNIVVLAPFALFEQPTYVALLLKDPAQQQYPRCARCTHRLHQLVHPEGAIFVAGNLHLP
jgi:hypothetical protein